MTLDDAVQPGIMDLGELGFVQPEDPKLNIERKLLLDPFNDPSVPKFLQEFVEGQSHPEFCNYLKIFVKQGMTMSDEELVKYGLRSDTKRACSSYGKCFSTRYYDALWNFCLTYGNKLIASLGFDVVIDMVIKQIQGPHKNRTGDTPELLKPIKWERALVTYAIGWAERNELPGVVVTSTKNNKWDKVRNRLGGKMHYDVTARRTRYKGRKFALNSDGDYLMDLSGKTVVTS